MKLRLVILSLLILSCVEPETALEAEAIEAFRAGGAVCVDESARTCRLDQLSAVCAATERNACHAGEPGACMTPGGPCEVVATGGVCGAGQVDPCDFI